MIGFWFYAFFLAFMGSMLGIVLSGNLVQLVFFWEMTSLLSFLLIGYWHHRGDARRGARRALVVTGSGGLCLLAGVLILGIIQLIAAGFLIGGSEFARWFGIGAAGLNAIGQLLFVPVYPWWATAMFTLDVLIIYGLVVYAGSRLRAV